MIHFGIVPRAFNKICAVQLRLTLVVQTIHDPAKTLTPEETVAMEHLSLPQQPSPLHCLILSLSLRQLHSLLATRQFDANDIDEFSSALIPAPPP